MTTHLAAGRRRWLTALGLLAAAAVTSVWFIGVSHKAPASAATWAPPWYAPYVDATLPMPQFPTRHVALSFVLGKGCTPTWGEQTTLDQATAINTRIKQAQSIGDQVIVSFGGEQGTELAASCTDPTQLANAYQTVVSRYGLSTLDLDIEGLQSLDSTVNARRAQAIATVQKAQAKVGKPLSVWLTLAVAPSGLTQDGLQTIRQFMGAMVTISGVNVMTFDYGPLGSQTMLSASEKALSAVASQVQPLGLAWSQIGATIMEGRTDVAGQTWNLSDAQAFYTFANAHHLARLSEWSLGRDQQCVGSPPQPSSSCSGVTQQPSQFSRILGQNAAQS